MWNCAVDDSRFNDISPAQWMWYGLMYTDEQSRKYDERLNFVEYLASFINSDAVKKIRSQREADKSGRFMEDEDFEDFVREGIFRDTEELDSIRKGNKNTNLDNYNASVRKDARSIRLPSDLSSVVKLTED